MVQLLPDVGNVYTVPLTSLINLTDAGFEDGSWCFRGLDEEHVEHLAESDMAAWPPLQVVRVLLATGNGFYAVIDGSHRWSAAIRKKAPTIRVQAATYASEDEVIEAAFRANLANGRNASTENRSEYALWLYLKDDSGKPNLSAIARKVGLNQSTVSRKINRELKRLENEEQAEARGTSLQEISETDKLLKAIRRYLENEQAFLGGERGERSVEKRASSLVKHISAIDDSGKAKRAAMDVQTLALTLAKIDFSGRGPKRQYS